MSPNAIYTFTSHSRNVVTVVAVGGFPIKSVYESFKAVFGGYYKVCLSVCVCAYVRVCVCVCREVCVKA